MNFSTKPIKLILGLALCGATFVACDTEKTEAKQAPEQTAVTEQAATEKVESQAPQAPIEKKNLVVLATGGTIAGAGEPGKDIGYKSGAIPAEQLIAAVPGLADIANITTEQVCNINSDDVNASIWFTLASRIQELLASDNVDGIIITHGTDTMEETAFFLSLVLKATKPVVMTGSMRPSTAAEPDGPANLLLAAKVAAGLEQSEKCGITCVAFAGDVYKAANVQKVDANALAAFAAIGNSNPDLKFDVSNLKKLPKVSTLFFNAESDAGLLSYAIKNSKGIVIAGAGAGEFSKEWIDVLSKAKIPVVITTRINRGSIVPGQLLVPGTIASYGLPPAKSAVLLRLALTKTSNAAEIQEMFAKFAE